MVPIWAIATYVVTSKVIEIALSSQKLLALYYSHGGCRLLGWQAGRGVVV